MFPYDQKTHDYSASQLPTNRYGDKVVTNKQTNSSLLDCLRRCTFLWNKSVQTVKLIKNSQNIEKSNFLFFIYSLKKFIVLFLEDEIITNYRVKVKTSLIMKDIYTLSFIWMYFLILIAFIRQMITHTKEVDLDKKRLIALNVEANTFQFKGDNNLIDYKSVPSLLSHQQESFSNLFFPKKYKFKSQQVRLEKNSSDRKFIALDWLWFLLPRRKLNTIKNPKKPRRRRKKSQSYSYPLKHRSLDELYKIIKIPEEFKNIEQIKLKIFEKSKKFKQAKLKRLEKRKKIKKKKEDELIKFLMEEDEAKAKAKAVKEKAEKAKDLVKKDKEGKKDKDKDKDKDKKKKLTELEKLAVKKLREFKLLIKDYNIDKRILYNRAKFDKYQKVLHKSKSKLKFLRYFKNRKRFSKRTSKKFIRLKNKKGLFEFKLKNLIRLKIKKWRFQNKSKGLKYSEPNGLFLYAHKKAYDIAKRKNEVSDVLGKLIFEMLHKYSLTQGKKYLLWVTKAAPIEFQGTPIILKEGRILRNSIRAKSKVIHSARAFAFTAKTQALSFIKKPFSETEGFRLMPKDLDLKDQDNISKLKLAEKWRFLRNKVIKGGSFVNWFKYFNFTSNIKNLHVQDDSKKNKLYFLDKLLPSKSSSTSVPTINQVYNGRFIYLDEAHDVITLERSQLNIKDFPFYKAISSPESPMTLKSLLYSLKSNWTSSNNALTRPYHTYYKHQKLQRKSFKSNFKAKKKEEKKKRNRFVKAKFSYSMTRKALANRQKGQGPGQNFPVYLTFTQWNNLLLSLKCREKKRIVKGRRYQREFIPPITNVSLPQELDLFYENSPFPYKSFDLEKYNIPLNEPLYSTRISRLENKNHGYASQPTGFYKQEKSKKVSYASKNIKKILKKNKEKQPLRVILPNNLLDCYSEGRYIFFYMGLFWLFFKDFSVSVIFSYIYYKIFNIAKDIILDMVIRLYQFLYSVKLERFIPLVKFLKPTLVRYPWQYFPSSNKTFEDFAEKDRLKLLFDRYVIALYNSNLKIGFPFFRKRQDLEILLKPLKSINFFKDKTQRNEGQNELMMKPLLLIGPPGTGKTLLVRAIAGEAKVPVIQYTTRKDHRQIKRDAMPAAERLTRVFQHAKTIAPCILFFDEMDSLAPRREGLFGEHPWAEFRYTTDKRPYDFEAIKAPIIHDEDYNNKLRLKRKSVSSNLYQFLFECNNLSPDAPILLIGSTNRPEAIDPAVRRHGRFSTTYKFSLPNEQQRIDFCYYYAEGQPIDSCIPWDYIVKRTRGFSPSDISIMMKESGLYRVIHNTVYTLEALEHGIDRVLGISKVHWGSRAMKNNPPNYIVREALHLAYYKIGIMLLPLFLKEEMPPIMKLWSVQDVSQVKQANVDESTQFDRSETVLNFEKKLVLAYGGKAAEFLRSKDDKNHSDQGSADLTIGQVFVAFLLDYYSLYSRALPLGLMPLEPKRRTARYWHRYDYNIHYFKPLIKGPSLKHKDPLLGHYGVEIEESYYAEKKKKSSKKPKDELAQSLASYSWWYKYMPLQSFPIWQIGLKALHWTHFWYNDPTLYFFNMDLMYKDMYVSELADPISTNWRFTHQGLRKLNKKMRTIWPIIRHITHEYMVSSLILTSLQKAINLLDEHREFVDICVHHLIKRDFLREPEVLEYLPRFGLEYIHPNKVREEKRRQKAIDDKVIIKPLSKVTIVSPSGGPRSRRPLPLWINVESLQKFKKQ